MTRFEFEEKYLKHNFFWIKNEKQSEELQKIFIEFGYKSPTGKAEPIKYFEKLVNLVTYQPDNWHEFKRFQRTDIYNPNYSFGEAVNYEKFISDYHKL